jgi:Spy/CpxP family protein refolding chaperone
MGGGGGGARGNFQGRGSGNTAAVNPSGGVLDQDQWDLLRQSLQKDGDQLSALEEKLRAAQKELIQACVATTYDEKVVREKAEAVSKIQVEITMVRAQSIAIVAPTLKPEQKDQMADSSFARTIITSGNVVDSTAEAGFGRGGFARGGAGFDPAGGMDPMGAGFGTGAGAGGFGRGAGANGFGSGGRGGRGGRGGAAGFGAGTGVGNGGAAVTSTNSNTDTGGRTARRRATTSTTQ